VRERGVARDAAQADQVGQRLLHGHHALGLAHRNLRPQLVVLALADQGAHGVGGDHDFGRRPARGAVHAGDQLLRDNRRQRQRQLLADLRLVARREGIQNPRHGLNGIVGVQGREHQVPGFGGGERRRHGFGVAHFAHQDERPASAA